MPDSADHYPSPLPPSSQTPALVFPYRALLQSGLHSRWLTNQDNRNTRKLSSLFRNVISTLLLTPDGHIMLDCGEGTIQQLERREGYGHWDILRSIKCIFISHAHADHHLGLIGLLRRRKRMKHPPQQPLYIVATRLVHLFLKEYQDLEDFGLWDDPAHNGVIQIVADALNYRHEEYPKTGP